MIKKIIVAAFVALTFVIYSIHQRNEGAAAVAQVTKNNNTDNTNSSVSTSSSAPSGPSTPSPSSSTTSANGQYKDGTYTGSQADAFYGYVQVQVTVSNGQVSDVTFLQHPNDRSYSVQINNYAMPILKQQAIKAQSSQVDGVSGATDTSQAFIQSLSDALSQAKA